MPNRGTVKKAGLLLVSLAICLLALEAVLRLGFEDRFVVPSDERSLSYAYDPELGWPPRARKRAAHPRESALLGAS